MKQGFTGNGRVTLQCDDGGVALLQLTREEKLNALDMPMLDELMAAGHALFNMPGLRCVILAGAGEGFCSGLDLEVLGQASDGIGQHLSDRTHGKANRFQQAAMQWRNLPVPVIAAIHGVCFGGGLQIAGGADIRIVAPGARLAILEMKWGVIPDMGGFALWRGTVRDDVLRELTYTGREFSGEQAGQLGFATMVHENPLDRAMDLAHEIASNNPTAVRAAKTLFNRYRDLSVDQVLIEESMSQQRLIGTRNQLEAMRARIESRTPDFSDP